MIVDSWAIAAVVLDETDGPHIAAATVDAASARMSATTWLETWFVIDGNNNPEPGRNFNVLPDRLGLEIVPSDRNQAEIARTAFGIYGKGMGHEANLNHGDGMASALAKSTGEPLLFKGRHVIQTGIIPALR